MEEVWRDVPVFPQFKDLSLEEKPLFDELFSRFPPIISEFTFTNLFIWRHAYQIKISRFQNFLCLLSAQERNSFFFPPIGEGDVVECSRMLLQYLEGMEFPQKLRGFLNLWWRGLIGAGKVLWPSLIETKATMFT